MKMIASGSYGSPNYHLDFINVIYGYILVFLYNIVPNVCWYDVVQLLILMFSFTNITYVLLNKKRDINPSIVYLLISIVAYSFYVWLQFTKSASVATFAGYLCIAYSLDDKNIKMRIVGIVMLAFGMWLRVTQFLSCSIICVSMFIPYIFIKEDAKDNIRKIVITAVICLSILLISFVVDNAEYGTNEWKTYREYQTKTAILTDFGWPNYDENKTVYEDLKIDRNAYELYSEWNYNDLNKLDSKEVDYLVENSSEKKIDIKYIVTFVYRSLNYFLNDGSISYLSLLVIAVLLLYLYSCKKTKIINCSIIYILISMIVLSAYCYYIRLDNFFNRIEVSYFFAVLMSLIVIIDFNEIKIHNIKSINSLCIVVFAICCLSRIDCINSNLLGIKNIDEEKKEVYNEIIKDSEHLYIQKTFEQVSKYDFNLLQNPKDCKFVNVTFLGGWMSNNPLLQKCLDQYDVKNPYQDVINNDKAYICTSSSIDQIVKYYQTYYNESIVATKVKNIDDYIVYKIEELQ